MLSARYKNVQGENNKKEIQSVTKEAELKEILQIAKMQKLFF